MKPWQWWALGGIGFLILASQGNRYRVIENFKAMKLSDNFSLDEFVRTSTGLDNIPNDEQIANIKALVQNILQPIRSRVGKSVVISSGFRSQAVNEAVGGAASSQHSKGQAADFTIAGMTNQQIIDLIRSMRLPYDQLIDEQLGGKAWVHVSFALGRSPRFEWLTARDNRANKYEVIQSGRIA